MTFTIDKNSFTGLERAIKVSVNPMSNLVFSNNHFLEAGKAAIEVSAQVTENLDASTTNWSTEDPVEIEKMIDNFEIEMLQ